MNIRDSYTAASSFPIKVAINESIIAAAKNGFIPPVHMQLNPTNKCNLNCQFCSCAGRDKNQELDIKLAFSIMEEFVELGMESVTITGGGEPLLYPYLFAIISYLHMRGVKVGLVTNGILLSKQNPVMLDMLTWCRISHSDERKFTSRYEADISRIRDKVNIDWAFSYVVGTTPDYSNVAKIIEYANEKNFTHVRLVADLYDVEDVPMKEVERQMKERGIDDGKVIYQARVDSTPGGPCYIGFLKPVVGPDSKIYTCCGAQYAFPGDYRCYPEQLCLGDAMNIVDIYEKSSMPFDGSICQTCYYMNYNRLLGSMLGNIDHKEFV